MIKYEQFYLKNVIRRLGDFSKLWKLEELQELPVGSVLHTAANLYGGYGKTASVVPDESLYTPYIGIKKLNMLFIKHLQQEDDLIKESLDGIRPVLTNVENDIRLFRNTDTSRFFLVKDPMSFNSSNAYLNVIAHDPIFKAIITGLMCLYRMFNIGLASMLNSAIRVPDYNHFFIFKTENIKLAKTDFMRTFEKYDRTTIKYKESTYYFIVMNLLGYLQGKDTPSMFNKVPENIISKINIVFQNEDKFLIYRLDVLKAFMEKSPATMLQIITQLNGLSLPSKEVKDTVVVNTTITEVVEYKDKTNTTKFSKTPTPEEDEQLSKQDVVEHDKTVTKTIYKDQKTTLDQKKYVKDLSQKYKDVPIKDNADNNTTISKVLEQKIDKKLATNDIPDAVKDSLPDSSGASCSFANFSQEYMNKIFKKDLVSSLVMFGKQGMYLQDFEEKDVDDNLSNITAYKATFKDKDGKQHTIKFSIPKVDEDGNCKINGSLKRMAIQRVNTPICKVSPSRVSLSSNYNKTIVERNDSFSNNFITYIKRIFTKAGNQVVVDIGSTTYPSVKLPYEYTSLASAFKSVSIPSAKIKWHFVFEERFGKNSDEYKLKSPLEEKYGVFFGMINNDKCFLDLKGVMSIVSSDNTVIKTTVLNTLKEALTDVVFPPFTEWVNFNVLNKKLPVIFVLSYRFGLGYMLKYLDVKYSIYGPTERVATKPSDLLIRFSDVKVVFEDLSMINRLIFSGLSDLDLADINHKDMDDKDTYYELIQSRKLSINYLRGIDDIFDLFIDPITEDILRQMGEPTNMKDLLIRATALLTTEDFNEAASEANFRYRSYERFNAIVYKNMARALTTYRNKAVGHANKFSISEYDIYGDIIADPLMENIDTINPVGDLKARHRYSHIGNGGRTEESMMIPDRRYPKDGIGIMSESTSDSGKVGIDGILSANPNIVNIRGMTISKDIKDITPEELLSPTSLLVPGADMDD